MNRFERLIEVSILKSILFFVQTYKQSGLFRTFINLIPYGILCTIVLAHLAGAIGGLEAIALFGAYITVSGKLVIMFNRKFRPFYSNAFYITTTTFGAGLCTTFGYLSLLSWYAERVNHIALSFPLSWVVTGMFFTSGAVWFLVFEKQTAQELLNPLLN